MTTAKDAQALAAYVAAMEQQHGHTPPVRDGALVDQRDEDRFAGWRLRGAAQAEQAAVDDTVYVMGNVAFGDDYFRQMMVEGVLFLVPVESQDEGAHILAAKKRRPQPAPVAGDAVRTIEVLRSIGSAFDRIPAPCEERDAIAAAIAALFRTGGQSAPAATSTAWAANGPNIGATAEASESVHRGATEGSTNA